MCDSVGVQSLLDKEAIREVVSTQYARAVDWRDLDLLRSCFHGDAVVDYGYFQGNAHEWCALAVQPAPNRTHRFHYTFHPYIEISDDLAWSEGTGITGQRVHDGEEERASLVGSRNFDKLERRDGKWRLSYRRVTLEFRHTFPQDTAESAIEFLSGIRPGHELFRPSTRL